MIWLLATIALAVALLALGALLGLLGMADDVREREEIARLEKRWLGSED